MDEIFSNKFKRKHLKESFKCPMEDLTPGKFFLLVFLFLNDNRNVNLETRLNTDYESGKLDKVNKMNIFAGFSKTATSTFISF